MRFHRLHPGRVGPGVPHVSGRLSHGLAGLLGVSLVVGWAVSFGWSPPLGTAHAERLAAVSLAPSGPVLALGSADEGAAGAGSVGSTVTYPLQFTANGSSVATVVFSIDYDSTKLVMDPADADGDGTPDAVQLSLPPAMNGMVSLSANTTAVVGKINVLLSGFSIPLPVLKDGTIARLTFRTREAGRPAADAVRFGAQPPPSFGSSTGGNLPGTVVDGTSKSQATVPPGQPSPTSASIVPPTAAASSNSPVPVAGNGNRPTATSATHGGAAPEAKNQTGGGNANGGGAPNASGAAAGAGLVGGSSTNGSQPLPGGASIAATAGAAMAGAATANADSPGGAMPAGPPGNGAPSGAADANVAGSAPVATWTPAGPSSGGGTGQATPPVGGRSAESGGSGAARAGSGWGMLVAAFVLLLVLAGWWLRRQG